MSGADVYPSHFKAMKQLFSKIFTMCYVEEQGFDFRDLLIAMRETSVLKSVFLRYCLMYSGQLAGDARQAVANCCSSCFFNN